MKIMAPDDPDRGPTPDRRLAVSEVASAIGRVRTRIRFGALASAAAALLVWLALVLVTLGLLDLSMGLGEPVRRWAVVALGAALGAWAVWVVVRIARIGRRHAAARLDGALLEQREGASGSEARSTLEFGEKTGASDLLSRTVARGIAKAAAERLEGFRTRSVRTGYRTRRAIGVCASVLLVAGAGQILAGDVVGSVGRRLLDPSGGHPRWSPIGVDIETERVDPSATDAEAGLWVGDSVRISSRIQSMPEQTRALLMVERSGSGPEPIPLDAVRIDREAGSAYRANMTLSAIGEPVRVWVELRGGPGTPQRWRASSRAIVLDPERRTRLRGARLTITPPAYTGLGERTMVWPGRSATSDRAVEAPQGSRLALDARAAIDPTDLGFPVGSAQVRLDPNAARAEWAQNEPGESQTAAILHGPDGRGDAVRMAITTVPDEPPVSEIAWPRRDEVVALEGAVVPMRVLAEDDYGITDSAIHAELRGDPSSAHRTALSDAPAAGVPSIRGGGSIDTGAMGAVAGDVIEVRVSASDNRPESLGGSQRTDSRVLRILVVDEERFCAMVGDELGESAAEAFRERQSGQSEGGGSESSGEPCPDCGSGSGACEGECEGNGEGDGQGSGSGSGRGSGEASGGSSAGAEAGEPRPWEGDRFFDGPETEPPATDEVQGQDAGDAQGDAPGAGEEGSGGTSDDGFRSESGSQSPEQPVAPPLADDPDGRGATAGEVEQDQADISAEAEAGVPERYRDLVRAYYRKRSERSPEGDQP